SCSSRRRRPSRRIRRRGRPARVRAPLSQSARSLRSPQLDSRCARGGPAARRSRPRTGDGARASARAPSRTRADRGRLPFGAMAPKQSVQLSGVVVAESAICSIDPDEGVLMYRGYDIADLAEHSTYEETALLLLDGELPSSDALSAFESELADRELPAEAA